MENIPRIHDVGSPREYSRSDERPTNSVNLSSSTTGSSSCQCTTTLHGEKKRNTERCEYNSKTIADYARIFPRGDWFFLEPGSEKIVRRTYSDKPDGSWDKIAEQVMLNFSESGHPIFRASPVPLRESK